MENKLYKHYKNNKLYEIIDFCKIQEEGNWVLAVIYKPYGEDRKFVRSVENFNKSFELWNIGKI